MYLPVFTVAPALIAPAFGAARQVPGVLPYPYVTQLPNQVHGTLNISILDCTYDRLGLTVRICVESLKSATRNSEYIHVTNHQTSCNSHIAGLRYLNVNS